MIQFIFVRLAQGLISSREEDPSLVFFVFLCLVITAGEDNLPLRKLLRNAVSGLDIIHGTRFFVVPVVRC